MYQIFDNIAKIKIDLSLLEEKKKPFYYKFHVISWQRLNDRNFFIFEDVDQDVIDWIDSRYCCDYITVKTGKRQVLNCFNSYFGPLEFANNYLYYKNHNFSAKDNKFTSPLYVFSIITTAVLTLVKGYEYIGLILRLIIWCSSPLFKLIAVIFNFLQTSNQIEDSIVLNDAAGLPVYKVLLPVFEESAIMQQLIESVEALDYPKSKLDVKLIIESGDREMLKVIECCSLPQYFDVIKVPHCLLKTKAKACNCAMHFVVGKYVVIYDADDKHDPLQLKKAPGGFCHGDDKLDCVQARLTYYNHSYNFLTRFFTLEYIKWFYYLLPGLQKMNMPIPPGGSSNHFVVEILRKVLLWDPYNVTEDEDLGTGLAQMGYKSKMIDSETMEEAPVTIWAWIKQRARWIKRIYANTHCTFEKYKITLQLHLP